MSKRLLFTVVLVLAGCTSSQSDEQIPEAFEPQVSPSNPLAGTAEGPGNPTLPVMPTQTVETEMNPSLPIPAVSNPQVLIQNAKEDLARQLSISTTQIGLLEIKEVFWPDTSLGCPQAGISYTQVLTPGYLIILESNGNQFEYHANIHKYVFHCENPTLPIQETPEDSNP